MSALYFNSFAEIVQMGGHGAYVWSAYAISLMLLAGLVLYPLRKSKQQKTRIAQRLRFNASDVVGED